jgi:hypothetical protein
MNKYTRAILAVTFIILVGVLCSCKSGGTPTPSTTLPTGPQSEILLEGDISVSAETNNDYAFVIKPEMKDVSITGIFETFGGAPNHIQVYLMDDSTYYNWLKHQTVHILFDSGLMSSGEINQAITNPGTYHLVYSNIAPATLSPEQKVKTTVTLKWTY